jgi:peptidoglycan hydrolase-like protein with peptidoglycan-binding domain
VLEPGATGPAVRALQCFLDDADYGPVLVDGVYGRQTRAAVARVESGFEGAPPHPGRIDRGMWVLLISRALGTTTLRQGATGPEVMTLQRALRAAGGTLEVDGVFGAQTRRVVTRFQKANSITADGVVGEETYFFLKSGGVITRG